MEVKKIIRIKDITMCTVFHDAIRAMLEWILFENSSDNRITFFFIVFEIVEKLQTVIKDYQTR
jgi:hypothetical protein